MNLRRIAEMHGRHVPDDVELSLSNGKIFMLSRYRKYDPVTIAIVAGLQAASQIQEGRAAEAEGEARQDLANLQAEQLQREAKTRQQAAGLEEERVAKREKIHKAEQRVAFAKTGISISESSSLGFIVDAAGEFTRERALTLRGGLLQSEALKFQAGLTIAEGKLAKQIGRQQKRASFVKAAGTGLSAFGSLQGQPVTTQRFGTISAKDAGLARKHGVSLNG